MNCLNSQTRIALVQWLSVGFELVPVLKSPTLSTKLHALYLFVKENFIGLLGLLGVVNWCQL